MSLERKITVMLYTGMPGSGKTWALTRYVADDWLPNHKGPVFTNLPLNVDAIAEYVARGDHAKRQEVLERITLVPQDVWETWEDGTSHPGEWLEKLDRERKQEEGDDSPHILGGALCIFDEAGKCWPSQYEDGDRDRKKTVASWARYVRTFRHNGARLIFCSQSRMDIAPAFRRLSPLEFVTENLADRRDAFTGAPRGHWYQLLAKMRGKYLSFCEVIEYNVSREQRDEGFYRYYPMYTTYFKLYNSHNLDRGGESGGEEKMEWERFAPPEYTFIGGWARFLLWLCWQNCLNWGVRFVGVLFVLALFCPPFSLFWRAGAFVMTELPKMVVFNKLPVTAQVQTVGAGQGAPSTAAAVTPAVQLVDAAALAVSEPLLDLAKEEFGPFEYLVAELKRERGKRTEAAQRLGLGVGVRLIHPQGAITDDGDEWTVGQKIEVGPYAGRVLQRVDIPRGACVLDDGSRVVISRVPVARHVGPNETPPAGRVDRLAQPLRAGPPSAGNLPPGHSPAAFERIENRLRERPEHDGGRPSPAPRGDLR